MFKLDQTYTLHSKCNNCSIKRTTFEKYGTTIIKEEFYASCHFNVTPTSDSDIELLTRSIENADYLVISDITDYEIIKLQEKISINWYSKDFDIDEFINEVYNADINSIAFLKINGFEIVNEEYIVSDGIIYLSSTVSV